MSAHIFIVEDEPELASLIADYARAAGYVATLFNDGAAALAAIRATAHGASSACPSGGQTRGSVSMPTIPAAPPDLVVLDLMLPGLGGLSVCRAVRAFSDLPIIMVTARVEEIDRLLGLEIGADDYLCKPFSPRELIARIQAILRRARVSAHAPTPAIAIDEASRRIHVNGMLLDLTPSEYAILAGMARRAGQVFSRAQLLDLARGDNLDVTDRAVDSHIKNLRRKLGAALPGVDPIASIYGLGYRLDL
jgi:two-component system response regulator BaeR